MKTQDPKLPVQTKPKSIQDYTPFELSEIDKFQNQNRGFIDESDEDLENDGIGHDSDYFWED